jgi:hypothetical protein
MSVMVRIAARLPGLDWAMRSAWPGRLPAYDPRMDEVRLPTTAAVGGLGLAAIALILAGASGGPYLSADAVNGWIVVFAVGAGMVLGAVPFALERRMRARIDDGDKRWERAMLIWAAVTGPVLVVGIALASGGDWSGGTLAGATGLILTIEAGLVAGAIVVALLSG